MPDLGKYSDAVLSAYAVSIAMIVFLVGMSLIRSRRVKRALAEAEARRTS